MTQTSTGRVQGGWRGRPIRPIWIILTVVALGISIWLHEVKHLSTSSLFVFTLTNINIILAVLLLILLTRNVAKLYFERRHRLLGAGFRAKLTMAFIGFALIPTVLLFLIASGYITKRIDYWFRIQAERPLENSLKIAQATYQATQQAVIHQAGQLAAQLRQDPHLAGDPPALAAFLEAKRQEYQLALVQVLDLRTETATTEVTAAGVDGPRTFPSDFLEQLKEGKEGGAVLAEEPGHFLLGASLISLQTAIVTASLIPHEQVTQLEEISIAYQDYKRLKTLKGPIKTNYVLSFFVITLVILFSATWFGFYLGRGITVPITQLSEGTQAVARGQLDVRIQTEATDELGVLVESFNIMAADLQASRTELEQRQRYIETIMNSIETGVFSISSEGKITTFNRAAERILKVKASQMKGRDASAALRALQLAPLESLVQEAQRNGATSLNGELQVEVERTPVTLQVNLSAPHDEAGRPIGVVVAFEDLTELIRAKKLAAWQEVAQRIAHEIKNPLTPIQLSAERLRKKYAEGAPDFEQVFEQGTATIINEVNDLKVMVDEFSMFARLPPPRPHPHRLHALIEEVIALYRGAHKDLEILATFAGDLPMLMVDREQVKRVFRNLFENAIEAMGARGRLWVTTTYDRHGGKAIIEVADEGPGITPADAERLFLPTFTKKKHGRGLGLAIVHRIIADHGGRILVKHNEPQGARFHIELPVESS